MKKIITFPIIILSLLTLSGCAESEQTLKKKCSEYINIAQNRIEEMNAENDSKATYSFFGTYYSKKRKSCITKYKEYSLIDDPSIDEAGMRERTNYYDEFTGEELVSYPQNLEQSRIEFEERLELIK